VGSFEVSCWRKMEKISWTDRVRNEEVLHRVQEEKSILRPINEGRLTEFVMSGRGTAFQNTLLKER
jgi:hypothetical protein